VGPSVYRPVPLLELADKHLLSDEPPQVSTVAGISLQRQPGVAAEQVSHVFLR